MSEQSELSGVSEYEWSGVSKWSEWSEWSERGGVE